MRSAMGSLSDYAEQKLLDLVLGNVPFSPPGTVYAAYFSGAPTESTPGSEPSGGGYGRTAIVNSDTNFAAAVGQEKVNATEVVFSEATTNHGTIVAIGLFDALIGGNLIGYAALPQPVGIEVGDKMRLPASSLKFKFRTGGCASNYLKNKLLDHMFGATPYVPPASVYFGYTTTAFTDAAAGTEPSGNGYQRSSQANNLNLFGPSSGGSKTLMAQILFQEATGLQGTAVELGIWDGLTAGNYLFHFLPTQQMVVTTNIQPYIAASSITITLD